MKIELTNTNWTEITGLEDGSTYFLQAKLEVEEAGAGMKHRYISQDINFARGESEPTDDKNAFYASAFKFKASGNTYVKAVTCPTIIYIEEV